MAKDRNEDQRKGKRRLKMPIPFEDAVESLLRVEAKKKRSAKKRDSKGTKKKR